MRVHILDRLLVNPLKAAALDAAALLARMHHGKVTGYAAYVLGAMVVALIAAVITLS